MENIRESMEKVAAAIAAEPHKARARNAPATASYAGGLQFSIGGPNGEKCDTDMPKGVGGTASAPPPGWMLRAALASCTGTVIVMRAAKLGVKLDKLDVTVESESDNRGMLGLDDRVSAALSGFRTRVFIRAENAAPAELEAIVRWADAHSPVGCTLRHVLSSDIEVDAG
jgi:uncharacterized OsmC-like protein